MESPMHVVVAVGAAGTVAACCHRTLALQSCKDSAYEAAAAAVVGGLTADAAAVTSHWVYDQVELATKIAELGGEDKAPFVDPPLNPYYHVNTGQQSCFPIDVARAHVDGDQALALLRALGSAPKATTSLENFQLTETVLEAYMGELDQICGGGSAYGPLDRQIAKGDMPIKGPWRHGSLKQHFANVQALEDPWRGAPGQKFDRFGGDDKQVDGVLKMAPVVAAYYQLGLEYVLQFAESAIRVTQNTDEAVAMGLAFARILYSLVTGAASTPSVAVTQCIDALKDPARAQPTKLDEHLARKLEDVQPKQGEAPVVDFIAAGQALGLKIN